MTLNITIDLPPEVEQQLIRNSANLAAEVKEAYAVDLFRRGILDHYGLSCVLNIDRFETDACLVRHGVFEGSLTLEDVEQDFRTLQELFGIER